MSSTMENIGMLIVLDIAFAMATGMTGIHGLIVDVGADFGQAVGIDPLFDAHAGHTHAADVVSGVETAASSGAASTIPEGCHYDTGSTQLHCEDHSAPASISWGA